VLLGFRLTDAATARSRETESGCCLLRTRSGLDADSADDIQFLPLDQTFGPASGGLLVSLMRPASTGRLRLRSQDAADDPVLDLRLLTERVDLDRLRGAVRHAAELLDHPALREVVEGRPALPHGDLDRWLRENCQAQYHPSGTCRMGPPDGPATVVDSEGGVLGVDGLWVADASVMPVPVGVPPYLSTVMVAERLTAAIGSRLRAAR
jgi:choline dehydrogenase-like flavoprotein